jgi:DNA invertase Pin-like site-specific DNA recombinase
MVGAVIYVRVSTKEQTENLSLTTQLRACEEYCRQGYEVAERFHEEARAPNPPIAVSSRTCSHTAV